MTFKSKSLKAIKYSNWLCIYTVFDFKNSDMTTSSVCIIYSDSIKIQLGKYLIHSNH